MYSNSNSSPSSAISSDLLLVTLVNPKIGGRKLKATEVPKVVVTEVKETQVRVQVRLNINTPALLAVLMLQCSTEAPTVGEFGEMERRRRKRMKNEKQEKENEMSMLELEQLVGKYGYAKEQEIESNRMCVMRR